jgi:gamma-resorcylate decarboxylase
MPVGRLGAGGNDLSRSDSVEGKIALEEHVSTEEHMQVWDRAQEAARNGKEYMKAVEHQLLNSEHRIEQMDEHGIGTAIVAMTANSAQGIPDAKKAVEFARRTNDLVADNYARRYPGRLYAFATVALQNPRAAADELERAVRDLGMKGAMIYGYSNIGDTQTGQYLDEEPVWEFWDRVASLNVPIYLHPREPLPNQRRIYEGYPALIGSAWGFAHETGTHAVRLMLSGLFDRYPNLQIILGHLGEGLPHLLPRLEWRLYKQHDGFGAKGLKKKVSEYFSENFYVTTSGHFNTKTLLNALSEIGVDRMMFSVDYPYEDIKDAATWFDHALLSENDRQRIGRENARRLFALP